MKKYLVPAVYFVVGGFVGFLMLQVLDHMIR